MSKAKAAPDAPQNDSSAATPEAPVSSVESAPPPMQDAAPRTMVAPAPSWPPVEMPVRGVGPKCRVCGGPTTNEGVRQLKNPELVRIRYECKNHVPPAVYEVITSKANCRQS